jgi:regulator of sigma E protease
LSTVASVLSAVFWGLLVLSVLVFVHEGGHYLAARAFHVRVTEFFLGLPCRWRLSRRSAKVGTEVGVTPLLLGGYTRICGMEGTADELLAAALACVMRRGRVSAADLAGELGCDTKRAYGLLATLTDWAAVRPFYDAELGESPAQRDYPAAFETLARDANLLTEYDRGHDFSLLGSTAAGEPHRTGLTDGELLAHERDRTYQGVGFLKRCLMLLAGPAVNIVLAFAIVTCALMVHGVDYAANVSTLGGVEASSVADEVGLAAGDSITAVDDTSVATWDELVDALSPHLEAGEDFSLTYARDGETKTVEVDLPDGEPTEALGIYSSVATYRPTLAEAAQASVAYAGEVASFAVRLVMPQHTMEVLGQSSSIVGIAVMASDAASTGPSNLALLAAAVSMSLGFMNLLPIPPLDGGKILIEVVQLALRRPLSTRVQNAVSLVGLAFFALVFLVVVRNDVLRFVIG